VIVPTTKLLVEMRDKMKELLNYDAGVFYGMKKEIKDITITTSKSYCENDL
jgi:superfamily II DNA or RNA helicase